MNFLSHRELAALQNINQNEYERYVIYMNDFEKMIPPEFARRNASMLKQDGVKLICMKDVTLQEVEWLWKPYIPFGKLVAIQGDPGDGKTTLALRIAAACSTGEALPNGERHDPFPVLYQTCEDGLGDTVKPRLMEAGANEENIFSIDEGEESLTFIDRRIETAIRQTGARLMIFDPIQAFFDAKTNMNSARDVRSVLRRLGDVAERTKCAIVLIGHLNKMQGANSSYRGLGSIDIRAACRSVLLVGRMRKDEQIRVVVHDKSSLAAEGKSFAFRLGTEDGFCWTEGYEHIRAKELLSGDTGDTKKATAAELILTMLESGEPVLQSEILAAAQEKGISKRTLDEAKNELGEVVTKKVGKYWTWQLPLTQAEECNSVICG